MKRFFDATPRFMVYFIGVSAILLLSLPYWLDLVPRANNKETIILADDTPESVKSIEPAVANLTLTAAAQPTSPLSHFGAIRLDATHAELKPVLDLHSLTVQGSDPEICEAATTPEIDHFTGCFSGGRLKEAFVLQREKFAGVETLQSDLIKQFGPPAKLTDSTGTAATPALLNLDTAKDWIPRIASLPFHRSLIWSDAHYQIEATIHYSSVDAAQSRAIMALHLRMTTSPLNQTLSHYTVHTLTSQPLSTD